MRIGPIKDFSALLVQDVLLSTATIPDDTRLYYTGNQKERGVSFKHCRIVAVIL